MPEGEFEFIAERLRPLAAGTPGALDLLDDAALLDPPAGMTLVLTKDAMVEGVHFLADDPTAQIAQEAASGQPVRSRRHGRNAARLSARPGPGQGDA